VIVKLSGPMVQPQSEAPRRAMVLLHGYGSDGNDLIGLVPYFRDLMPDALFAAPNAPRSCAINPLGYEWFPVSFDGLFGGFDGIQSARPVVAEFLYDLWAQTGIGPAETILAGFSQGAMIALDTGLSLDAGLCGILSFSGGIPLGQTPDLHGGPEVPICIVHGDQDPVVPLEMSQHAEKLLSAAGHRVRLHVSKGLGHGIDGDGVDFARRFVAEIAVDEAN